ncbi:hypothetical protein FA15DRAFT_651239 [Coprinopsis marcescibilis]|uniref:Uncharacterized protein n=1 Tax=Coprinopsis marcescibilis TaxID=230819 RepID=A0A5C3LCD1_COPMA|nr:hypothetical protein FA15DRAFT_651239 [Coprinopsis marcescibilis]
MHERSITSYFPKKSTKPGKRKRKLTYDSQASSSSSVKRSKSESSGKVESISTAVASSSKGKARRDVIDLLSDDLDYSVSSKDWVSSVPTASTSGGSPVSAPTGNRRLLNINTSQNATGSSRSLSPASPLTPLPSDYESDSTPQATQENPNATSSFGPQRATLHVNFSTPRTNRLLSTDTDEESDAKKQTASPRVIHSSQTQYPSPFKSTSIFARGLFQEFDYVPSSQTQELEIYPRYSGKPTDPSELSRSTPASPLKNLGSTSFSEELPVRHLNLGGSLRASVEPESPTQRPEASQSGGFPPSSGIGQAHNQSFPESQLFAQSRTFKQISISFASPDPPSPSQIKRGKPSELVSRPSSPLLSQYDGSATQEAEYSYPSALAGVRDMFEGDESYPPDFPMSLRI